MGLPRAAAGARPAGDTSTVVEDRVAASRRLLPLLWSGEDVDGEVQALLAASRADGDAEGECGALYVALAAAAVKGESERSRVAASSLVQRGAQAGLAVWESLGHTHLARLYLADDHEDLALSEVVEAELLLDDAPSDAILAVAFSGLAATYSSLAVYEDAERLYGRCATVLATSPDAWAEQALVYNRLLNHATWGLALHRAGDAEQARRLLTIAVDQVRDAGDLSGSKLWSDLGALCLFADVLIGRIEPADAVTQLDELCAAGNVESESYVRFALAHRLADSGCIAEARDHVAAGLAAVHPIEGFAVRTALTWERARIAVLEQPDETGRRDVWEYATLATGMVWELRRRRVEAVHDRLRIGRLRRAHERAQRAADEDPLTGLVNRRRLDRERTLLAEQGASGWVTVAYMDIDRFKEVNDSLGHDRGDAVLRALASLLVTQVRSGDLLGRYGGDEFVIVAHECPPDAAATLADRIVDAVRSYDWAPIVGDDLTVRLSVGVASGERGHGELFPRADDALYAAKRGGRDRAERVVVGTAEES